MNLLIVSATEDEIMPLLKNSSGSIEFLTTGPGIVSTIYHLTKKLSEKKFDLVINAGIAGGFNRNFSLGDVVAVTKDCFADFGAEDGDAFIPFHELTISDTDLLLKNKFLENNFSVNSKTFLSLPKATGITVNTVHGNEASIKKMVAAIDPDIETMETAAVFYCCLKEKQNVIAVRAVSNYVERRDKSKWEIEKAIANLNTVVKNIIDEINIHT